MRLKIYILYVALLDNWEDTAAVEQKRKRSFFFSYTFLRDVAKNREQETEVFQSHFIPRRDKGRPPLRIMDNRGGPWFSITAK